MNDGVQRRIGDRCGTSCILSELSRSCSTTCLNALLVDEPRRFAVDCVRRKEGRKLLVIYSLAELAVFVGGRGGEEIDSCVVDDCQRKVLFGDLGAHDSQSCSQRRHLN